MTSGVSQSYLQNVPLSYLKSIEDSYKKTFLPQIRFGFMAPFSNGSYCNRVIVVLVIVVVVVAVVFLVPGGKLDGSRYTQHKAFHK